MKRVAMFFVVLYCLRSDGAYISFTGMDQPSIDSMLTAQVQSCQYISQASYTAGVLTKIPATPTPIQVLTQAKTQASSLVNTGADANSELQRAAMLTILDQINTIRASLPNSLSAITPTQVKTAVQNKINSGAAD